MTEIKKGQLWERRHVPTGTYFAHRILAVEARGDDPHIWAWTQVVRSHEPVFHGKDVGNYPATPTLHAFLLKDQTWWPREGWIWTLIEDV